MKLYTVKQIELIRCYSINLRIICQYKFWKISLIQLISHGYCLSTWNGVLLWFCSFLQILFCWNVEWHLTPEPGKLYFLLFYGQYVQRSVSFLLAISDQLGFSKRYFGVFKQHLTFCSSFIPWGSICSLIFPYSKIFCLLTFDVR